jgi:hypothetical protein
MSSLRSSSTCSPSPVVVEWPAKHPLYMQYRAWISVDGQQIDFEDGTAYTCSLDASFEACDRDLQRLHGSNQ